MSRSTNDTQAQELIPAGEASRSIVAAVARHASSELTIRKEGNQLREHGAAKVHPSWCQPRVSSSGISNRGNSKEASTAYSSVSCRRRVAR